MMRKCHLNTCPVGVAHARPGCCGPSSRVSPSTPSTSSSSSPRRSARSWRGLGYRSFNEMIGQSQCLDKQRAIGHWKARGLDFEKLFHKPDVPETVAIYNCERQDHGLGKVLDVRLLELAMPALAEKRPSRSSSPSPTAIAPPGRCCPARLPSATGHTGLPEDSVWLSFAGHGRPEFWRLAGARRDPRSRRRGQRLRRQGLVGRQADRAPRPGLGHHPRGKHHRWQYGALRCHQRGVLFPRRCRRALCRAQLRAPSPWWRGPAITAAST